MRPAWLMRWSGSRSWRPHNSRGVALASGCWIRRGNAMGTERRARRPAAAR
jgi:hypothetical protein